MDVRLVVWCISLLLVTFVLSTAAADKTSAQRRLERERYERWRKEHCTNCTVKGKEYQGHSRFRYEEGCNRFRCICRCNGSWECPASQTINICGKDAVRHNRRTTSKNRSSRHDRQRHRCQTCKVGGKEHRSNAYFRHVDGCTTYDRCICYCNGSWVCPATNAKNTCQEGVEEANRQERKEAGTKQHSKQGEEAASGQSRRNENQNRYQRCRNCTALGKEVKGNSYFSGQEGCKNFTRCACYCDGSWNCPDRFVRNICEDKDASENSQQQNSCKTCAVKGLTFPGRSYFNLTDGCIAYKNCKCNCDGSWSCSNSNASNICTENNGESRKARGSGKRPGETSCKECYVRGKTIRGNDQFNITEGCAEYTNCNCYCNGSWSCPLGKDICTPDDTRREESGSKTNACKACVAKGKRFAPNSYFVLKDNCTEYSDCICNCDGSWNCPASGARNVCEVGRGGRDGNCRDCEVYGETFEATKNFTITRGCWQYNDCSCHCNGSWECPATSSREICDDRGGEITDGRENKEESETSAQQSKECVNCNAKGKIVTGGTYFEHTDGCDHYSSCKCNCDGSWNCPPEMHQDICFDEENRGSGSQCSMCKAKDGKFYQPNKPFTFIDDCIKRDCDCFCNGSWSCPGERSRWICTERCRGCEVEGRKIRENSVFKHKTGCLEYTCNCYCNGSWSCPGETVRNTCPVGVRDNCNTCQVSASEQYPGESDFVLKQGCLHYKCRCNCDGSYSCPAEDSRNVCYGEELGGCRSCVLSKNEFYKGESDFTLKQGCIAYQCRCNCNGTWQCPSEKARNVCVSKVRDNCRDCRIEDGKTFRGNTSFEFRKDCFHYTCKCNCDGSWSCPGKDIRNVCKGEVPGGCRSCVLAENEFYPGNSNFEMVKDCIHYKCRCKCDGSYNCPAHRARRVCAARQNQVEKVEKPIENQCKRCHVSEYGLFESNTEFTIRRGCQKYKCKCECDGSWRCPTERIENVCRKNVQRERITKQQQCQVCRRDKKEFDGGSNFTITRGCYRYDCFCNCDGTSRCDTRNPTYICSDQRRYPATNEYETRRRVETKRRQRCRPCNVIGTQVNNFQRFYLESGCLLYKGCECRCSGEWQCAEKEKVCEDGNEKNERNVVVRFESDSSSQSPSRSSSFSSSSYSSRSSEPRRGAYRGNQRKKTDTLNVESSAWVHVDGVDSSFVKVGDKDKTGGGYKIEIKTKYAPTHTHRGGRRRLGELKASDRVFTSSGSSQSKETYLQHEVDTTETTSSPASGKGESQCKRCLADTKYYPSGANFVMRRGCVVYKCFCLCSGSYRCLPTFDRACNMEKQQSSCRNCLYDSLIFPGKMGFTVREGCQEKQCNCFCNGTYSCPSSKPLAGCSVSSPTAARHPSLGSFYPINHGFHPTSVGYVRRTGNAVYTRCPSCGAGTPVVYHTPVRAVHETERSGESEASGGSHEEDSCTGCDVEGTHRAGGSQFTFQKECVEFDCYCACGGSWKCAGRALNCTARPEVIPNSNRRRGPERLVKDEEY
ncbi:hypothetical protein PoB_001224200 [Plakobranchus ocellatus]|uniref:Uncharacterized protein n=1 Tax=Plakobranchus ocellatus TaxID=259542 RepID=A0AAV3YTD9_9GAST|nr:hypothetical protein PoB_001224200 [Plakobranchus ocellatus]